MNAQTTQRTLKAAINNALELRSMTTRRTNNLKHNFELESHQCLFCTFDCGIGCI